MIMERSSETSWQQPFGSRRRDTSTSSDQNLRLLHASRISLSADTSHNSVLGTGRKAREQIGQSPSDHLRNWINASGEFEDQVVVYPLVHRVEFGDVSLRQWLDNPERAVDAIECLHIFRQIVEIVSAAHSQGIVVNNIRPSCFVMSSFNHVSFIESASCSDSGSDSLEDGLNNQNLETNRSSPPTSHDLPEWKSRPGSKESPLMSEMSCLQSTSAWGMHLPSEVERGEYETKDCGNLEQAEEKKHTFPMKEVLVMETSWYTSPEEIAGAQSSCASDIYRLGVLLFELFCTFSSIQEKSRTMASLRHRVLPPQLLLKWPKEASFCLWLLHPDPCSRPKMGELLQSEFLNEPRHDIEEREAAIELREKIEEQELLLEFLVLIRQNKQEAANKLHDTISFLSTDIKEIVNKQRALREKRGATLQIHNTAKGDLLEDESHNSEMATETQNNLLFKNTRLMKNFKELESAYLLTRHKQPARQSRNPLTGRSPTSSNSRGSVVLTERSVNNSSHKEILDEDGESGWISPFLEGLCKYLSFTKLKVKADLKHGDLLNSSNLVCCVTFDRDGEFFATAGVNKKIKVFEYGAILNEDRDIHYPVVEMTSRSKLSSICWNSYIKSQIASSNFEGTVQVWDATRSQVFMELREHERRVWSVDFSSADPTILASGSDDGSVKLWSINQGTSIGTIRAKANVCCVQFPVDSGHSLAFGSADHRVYYYDLRSPRVPLCTLVGHNRTVSYIKFIDSTNLVSASTDNTLKLWDLSMSTSRVLDTPLQSFTGHTNVKNFVGLSTWDGYIATGSETNEVFVYHKAFPMPALSFKFNSIDPLTGTEMDDTSQFISSVCWRGNSSTLVAANSTGDVKLLEMV